MARLQELSLDWFLYAKPTKDKLIKRNLGKGDKILTSLFNLCELLEKYKMDQCELITFLDNYSGNNFNKDQVDNRNKTLLHHAAAKGDNGVIEGLLYGDANPNFLDKDQCTPLCVAIRDENFVGARILIERDADVNIGGGIYGSALHLAVVKTEI